MKYIHKSPRRAIVEAEQWFPGRECQGLCHCQSVTFLEGEKRPHIHKEAFSGMAFLLSPGSWIVTWSNGQRTEYADALFRENFMNADEDKCSDALLRATMLCYHYASDNGFDLSNTSEWREIGPAIGMTGKPENDEIRAWCVHLLIERGWRASLACSHVDMLIAPGEKPPGG